jgi:hypothetical protein
MVEFISTVERRYRLTSTEVDTEQYTFHRAAAVKRPRFFVAIVGFAPDQLMCVL